MTATSRPTDAADMLAKQAASIKRIDGAKTDNAAQLNYIASLQGEGENVTDSIAGTLLNTTGYQLDSAATRAGFYLDASLTGGGELDL